MSATCQPDLFDAPAAEPAPLDFEPYSWAELEALGRQLAAMARVPDEWLPGWLEMYTRGYKTIRAMPVGERRNQARAMFLDEIDRLYAVDEAEGRAAKAASAPPAPKRRKRAG